MNEKDALSITLKALKRIELNTKGNKDWYMQMIHAVARDAINSVEDKEDSK